MNKNTIHILTLAIAIIVGCHSFDLYGQSSFDQTKELKFLFEKNITNSHQEKIFIHTDRSLYVIGETIWMSAYCVDAALHIPTELSKVLNVELINSKGESVKTERIQLNKSLGKGQMFISPEISSGVYTLRGFTNWMKNFDAELVFKKHITIINPSSPPTPDEEANSSNDIDISFFPEGGNLVYDLKSKVVVKTTDNQGNGVSISGIIFDQNDIEVTKFNTSIEGNTFFLFTPKPNDTYTAVVVLNEQIKKYELPQPKSAGAVLSVVNLTQGEFVIGVNSKNIDSEKLIFVLHTRGIINKIHPLEANKPTSIHISEDDITEGVSHLTILDSKFNPLSERLIFNYPKNLTDINLDLAKDSFTNREKIDITIQSKDLLTESDKAFLSISVFQSNDFNKYEDNIISSLLLTSDIKGRIANPWSLFDVSNNQRKQQMDMVMLINGWRRFEWDQLLSEDAPKYKYPSEMDAPLLSGKFNPETRESMPRSVYIGLPGKASLLNSADFDNEGNFHFDIPFRIRNNEVLFFINSPELHAEELEIYNPFDLYFNNRNLSQTNFQLNSKKYLEGLNVNIQLSQVYRDYNNINGLLEETPEIKHHFYGEPHYTYILDNYTRFETIKDLFIEYIRSAVIRKRDNENGFYVVGENHVFPRKAMTLIDGIPIMDADFILNFDPLRIEKIGVVNNVYYMGSVGFQGIINFTTYDGDFDLAELPEYLVKKTYQGIQQRREFYSPNYSSQKEPLERIPDFRNTLYWNPQVSLQANQKQKIEFYTSDTNANYDVVVTGITSAGKPIYKKVNFSVNKNLP